MNKIIITSAIVMFCISNSIAAKAGNINGPKLIADSVKANNTYFHDISFVGGALAKIEVKGYGTTNLNCAILNSDNKEITIYNSDKGYCEFKLLPKQTSQYKLLIKNLGDNTNYFVIETN